MSLERSSLWPSVTVYRLHENMRVRTLLDGGGPNAAENAARQQVLLITCKALVKVQKERMMHSVRVRYSYPLIYVVGNT